MWQLYCWQELTGEKTSLTERPALAPSWFLAATQSAGCYHLESPKWFVSGILKGLPPSIWNCPTAAIFRKELVLCPTSSGYLTGGYFWEGLLCGAILPVGLPARRDLFCPICANLLQDLSHDPGHMGFDTKKYCFELQGAAGNSTLGFYQLLLCSCCVFKLNFTVYDPNC